MHRIYHSMKNKSYTNTHNIIHIHVGHAIIYNFLTFLIKSHLQFYMYTTKFKGLNLFHTRKFCNKCGTTHEIHKNGTLNYVVHIWPPHANCKQFRYMCTQHIHEECTCHMTIPHVDHMQTENIMHLSHMQHFWLCTSGSHTIIIITCTFILYWLCNDVQHHKDHGY